MSHFTSCKNLDILNINVYKDNVVFYWLFSYTVMLSVIVE